MSFPSHRLPPPVSQTVGGAAAATVAARSDQLADNPAVTETSPVADRYRQAKVLRQPGQGSSTTVVEPSVPASRSMLPAKQDSASTTAAKGTSVATETKQTGSDIPRPMRPPSVLKYYMRYLTPYEHQEIFNYSQVKSRARSLFVCIILCWVK